MAERPWRGPPPAGSLNKKHKVAHYDSNLMFNVQCSYKKNIEGEDKKNEGFKDKELCDYYIS